MIDVLARIKELRDARGWTNYRLTEEAQLNNSIIQNMFTRHTLPSITTLNAICNAFNISLSEFFNESDHQPNLTAQEIKIIFAFRKLSTKNQNIINNLINELNN